MLRFLISLSMVLGIGVAIQLSAAEKARVSVPVATLFNHKVHLKAFKDKVSCTDCHSFSVKSDVKDPLSAPIGKGHLKVDRKSCHACHLHSLTQPTPNQCVLCHSDTKAIMPDSHHLNWNFRHGRVAQSNPESCKDCHREADCNKCHTQRDAVKPMVHRPNFRLTHGIEARARPESCASCHSTTNTCTKCHTKGAP